MDSKPPSDSSALPAGSPQAPIGEPPPRDPPRLRWGLMLGVWMLLFLPLLVCRTALPAPQGLHILGRLDRLIQADRLHEARLVAEYALKHSLADEGELQRNLGAIEAGSNSFTRKASRAARGFLTGQAEGAEGLAGAVASDMLVLGNLRDLGVEAYKKATGGEADPFVATLSGVGAATTLAPPLSLAVSLMKNGAKLMPLQLKSAMSEVLAEARRTGDWSRAQSLLGSVGTLAQELGAASTMLVLETAEGLDEMEGLVEVARTIGEDLIAILDIYGEKAKELLLWAREQGYLNRAMTALTFTEWLQWLPWWTLALLCFLPALLLARTVRGLEAWLRH